MESHIQFDGFIKDVMFYFYLVVVMVGITGLTELFSEDDVICIPGYYDVIVVLIGWPELERRSLAVSFDEAFWLVAVFLLFGLTITEPFSPIYLEEMKNHYSLNVSRTVNQLIMRVHKPKVEYKLALQLDPREHLDVLL